MTDVNIMENTKRLQKARKAVTEICEEKDWSIQKTSDFSQLLAEIDSRYDQRRYKCRYCFDSGIVSWMDPDDGMFYGRRCGFCRYWDDQRERMKK